MMNRTIAIALLSLLMTALGLAQDTETTSAVKSGTGTQQTIKQLEQQIRGEVMKGQTSAMQQFEADDYVAIGAGGMMSDKNQSIQMLKDGKVKFTAIDVTEERVRMYGDTAIYNGLANTKMTVNGKDYSGDYRVTIVWSKLNGEWKRVSFQTTPVTPQAAP